jgi:hypothetical protein
MQYLVLAGAIRMTLLLIFAFLFTLPTLRLVFYSVDDSAESDEHAGNKRKSIVKKKSMAGGFQKKGMNKNPRKKY